MFDTFAYFTKLFPQVCLVLGILLAISGEVFILPLHLNYICVSIDMFLHIVMVSVLLCLWILYHLIVGYTSSWYFVLYISCVYVIPPLSHCSIYVCINMFVNVISMVTAKWMCTSYNLILGCATYWALCNKYFLYIIGYYVVVTLVELNSQNRLISRCLN